MNENPCARLIAYGVALLATSVSLSVRWHLWPVLGDRVWYLAFVPAVLIAAYFGGLWPGLLATVLSALAATYSLVESSDSLEITTVQGAVALALFVLVGVLISGLSESLRRARLRIAADDRRRAEEALRESEERFRTFVDHATDAFFLQAEDGVILDVNRQACEGLGYTRDELIGMTPLTFDPDFTPAAMEELRRGDESEEVAFESRHRRKDGTEFPVEIRGRWFREGGRRFVVCLARDITERKRLEAELRRATDRLDMAIRASNVGIWEVDMPDGVYANGTGTWINVWEQLGIEPPGEDSPFVSWLDYLPPEDKDRLLRALHAYLNRETKEYRIEYRIRHRDGNYRWMLARGTAIRDQAGQPIRLVGSRVDITELKRVEEVLRESEAWFRFLANAMPQIVWTARPDGACDYLNQRCEDYTGIPVAEMLEEGWLSYLHPDDRDAATTKWRAALESGFDLDVEWRLRGADGVYRWFKTRGLAVRDGSGRVLKWLGTSTDIDEQSAPRRRCGRPRRRPRRRTGPRTSSWRTSATRSGPR